MGSFSWLKADSLTQVNNIAYGEPFKCLIPQKYGGGFIKDYYQDYGYLGRTEEGKPKYDMYELLAFWNHEQLEAKSKELYYEGEFPKLKTIDDHTQKNRNRGIDIGCYDDDIDKLKYPLKLVSVSFKGTYEEIKSPSYGDPNQGFYKTYRA